MSILSANRIGFERYRAQFVEIALTIDARDIPVVLQRS